MKALMMTGYGDADSNLAVHEVAEPTLGTANSGVATWLAARL